MDWRRGSSNRAPALAKPEALTSNPCLSKKKKKKNPCPNGAHPLQDGRWAINK
jgi:hypothetical protein